MNKRKLITSIIAVAMLISMLSISLSGCSLFGRGDINDFADELLTSLFTNDALSANFFIENPQEYLGITPTASLSEPMESADAYYSNCKAMKTQAALMAASYRYSKMSAEEKELFDFLQNFFIQQSEFADYYYLQDDYIGGYSGAQANLPVYLTEYNFRREQDIKDYIALCTQSTTVFPTWVTFEQARIDNGYGRMRFVLEYALEQCESFTGVSIADAIDINPANPAYIQNENFVLTNGLGKVDACTFLNEEQKTEYKRQITTAINTNLIPAYIQLGLDIKAIIVNPDNQNKFVSGGLAAYGETGKKYYQTLFSYSTATDTTVADAYTQCMTAYNKTIAELNAIRTSLSDSGIADVDAEVAKLFDTDYTDNWNESSLQTTISALKERLAPNFPAMADTEGSILLKIVDESLADNYAPAAYFVSALDNNNSNEVIIINNWESTGYISYDLLSHEGIPGHLYQYNYLKNNDNIKDVVKVLCPTAYKEGWATYAEHFVAAQYSTDATQNMLLQYQVKKTLAQGYIRVMADILVNYNGYGTEMLTSWLNTACGIDTATGALAFLLPVYHEDDGSSATATPAQYANNLAANSIMFPCNAATYYYGYLQVSEIIAGLKAKGFSYYDAHKAYLDSPYTFTQIKNKYGI